MGRRLKHDIPGIDWRVDAEELAKHGPEPCFAPELAPPLELVVDVGFGRGEFLMALARERPEVAFLGIELSHKRVLKMARRLARSELRNVRLVEGRAEPIVAQGLAPESVSVFWINFPDPWPKKRHHRRRLLQPGFVRELALRLRPGGRLHVATDHAEYAEAVHEALAAEPLFENLHAPEPFRRGVEDRPATAYELEWRAEGRSFHFFDYRRCGDARAGDG